MTQYFEIRCVYDTKIDILVNLPNLTQLRIMLQKDYYTRYCNKRIVPALSFQCLFGLKKSL